MREVSLVLVVRTQRHLNDENDHGMSCLIGKIVTPLCGYLQQSPIVSTLNTFLMSASLSKAP
jgi:hypothetical protein